MKVLQHMSFCTGHIFGFQHLKYVLQIPVNLCSFLSPGGLYGAEGLVTWRSGAATWHLTSQGLSDVSHINRSRGPILRILQGLALGFGPIKSFCKLLTFWRPAHNHSDSHSLSFNFG